MRARRPSSPGSFDAVLTPWFIDVAGEPVSRLLADAINALLAPGGLWVHHGSLAFADAAPAEAPSLEELLDALPAHGFEPAQAREASQPYLGSPASRHARLESVVTFAARKARDVRRLRRPAANCPHGSSAPTSRCRPCPQFRAQALSTRVYAFLLAMIDGERTIRDMARLMEQQKLMPADDAVPAIRRFLARALAGSGPTAAVLSRTCPVSGGPIIVTQWEQLIRAATWAAGRDRRRGGLRRHRAAPRREHQRALVRGRGGLHLPDRLPLLQRLDRRAGAAVSTRRGRRPRSGSTTAATSCRRTARSCSAITSRRSRAPGR